MAARAFSQVCRHRLANAWADGTSTSGKIGVVTPRQYCCAGLVGHKHAAGRTSSWVGLGGFRRRRTVASTSQVSVVVRQEAGKMVSGSLETPRQD
ncbi:hypothetical protein DPEC_G00167260 [Dallia pectoralis]|uniref:Uncharacterized protein n=1 Tax=Dallia pectoralis TaxID=75939 RepID=A0ACC2GI47_DALPE|nr:hypothetical protein DPEC_G00167260 [Dallia pectoralis]